MDRGGGRGNYHHPAGSCVLTPLSQLEADTADLAVSNFLCTHSRTLVALCLPGVSYQPVYWFSRCTHICSEAFW